MYAIFGNQSENDIHLMDPWLDGPNEKILQDMKDTFTAHYTG